MKIRLWSETKAGKWAAVLTLIFIVTILIKISALAMVIRLPLPSPILAVFGAAGFVMGIISMIKYKDRALLTLLSIPVGLLIIFWIAAELAFPH